MMLKTYQSDEKIIQELLRTCEFEFNIEEGFCTKISFQDEEGYGSKIRRHPFKNEIVKVVSNFCKLRSINLRKSRLGTLPTFLSRELEHVDLSCNGLETFPDWLMDCPVKHLNLGSNQFERLPDMSGLPLEALKLHKNTSLSEMPRVPRHIRNLNAFLLPKVDSVPEFVLELKDLESFSFGATRMKSMPDFSSMSNLRFLTVTVNEIESVPEGLCLMKNLEFLCLAKNKIEHLPSSFGSLKMLKSLTLYSNRLMSLPASFFDLDLQKLNLCGNPIANKNEIVSRFGNIPFFRI